MQPDNQNPYGFILDPSQNRTSGPAFLQDPKKRMIVAILFVLGVLFLAVIGFAIVSSLGKKGNSAMADVVAYQTEISRITELGLKSAVDPAVKAQTTTINTFIASDLSQTTAYLSESGKKLTELEIASKKNPTIDKDLENASLRNSFDEALIDAIEEVSAEYKLALKKAIDGSSSEKEKSILDAAAANILTYENPL